MFQSPQWGSNSKVFTSKHCFPALSFQSPQWGSNSKEEFEEYISSIEGFSPRNGEVILKRKDIKTKNVEFMFQSPQWGSNSKG